METNSASSSSSPTIVTITETFKFKGKGATVALLIMLGMSAVIIAAMIYKCIRGRQDDPQVNGQGQAGPEIELVAQNNIPFSASL
ncbi:hypothetical protein REPUB_Repub15cG0024700 [Reevesia pubescens]